MTQSHISTIRSGKSVRTSRMVAAAQRGLIAFATAIALTMATTVLVDAKQTSIDKRIFEVYEDIDGRTRAHEADSARIHQQLKRLSEQFEQEISKFGAPTPGTSDVERRRQSRERTARLTKHAAEYLSQAYKLVDSAAGVISRNLTDLATLADEIRKSGDPAGGATTLQTRIQRNIASGRAMRLALNELGNWARQDTGLVGKFNSLKRVMHSLDRRVSLDQARLHALQAKSGGTEQGRLDAIDRAVDRLADLHVEVDQERQAIIDARNDVKMLITLGRLEVTEEIAERAIPRVSSSDGSTVGVPGLTGIDLSLHPGFSSFLPA